MWLDLTISWKSHYHKIRYIMIRIRSVINLLLSVVILTCVLLPQSEAAAVPADKVKAGYIYQFLQFVSWPESSSSGETSINICVLGNDPIANELEPLNMTRVGQQNLKIRTAENIQDTLDCNILYISEASNWSLKDLLTHIDNKPVLTVSSLPDFAGNGGIIGFVIKNDKIRLEINRTPAHRSNIQLNAKLLEVASVVIDVEPGGESR